MHTLATETMGVAQRYWRMSLVRGIILILFGIIVIVWPRMTFRLFFLVFGIFAIIEGIVLCINAFAHRNASRSSSALPQGRSYFQRADRPAQEGTPYQRTERPAQEGMPYQRAEPAQERGAAYRGTEAAAAPGSLPFQRNWITLLAEGLLTIIAGILCLILPGIVAALAIYVVAAWAMFKGISAFMQIHQRGWTMALIGVLAIIMSLFLFIDPIGAIRTFLWGVGVFALIIGIILVARGLQHSAATRRAAPPPEPSY